MRGPKPRPKPSTTEQTPPAPPEELTDEAKAEWERITNILTRQRIWSEADQAALIIYCTSYADYRHASKMVRENGTVILSNSGTPVKNPYCSVQRDCWERIRPLLAEFGLSPSSRARLKLDDGGAGDSDDEFD